MTKQASRESLPRDVAVIRSAKKIRRTPQQTRAITSRENAIEGAKAALEQYGYAKLTMRNVAALSKVGVGTIYDYFPSKHAMLHELLQARLSLRLQIFDDTYAAISANASVSSFIHSYLETMGASGLWSKYDRELQRAADEDDGMQKLLDWHHEQTQKRYVDALLAAGSPWPQKDLELVADYLLTIATQFEYGLAVSSNAYPQKVTSWLIRKTFLSIIRDTLLKKPHRWL